MKLNMLLLAGMAAFLLTACTSSEYSQTKVIKDGAGAGTTWTPNPNAPADTTTKVVVEDETLVSP